MYCCLVKGIFTHGWGKFENEHAAKLIGWGTKDGVQYWLLLNSFSKHWGENGTFRVPRNGVDDHFEFGYAIVAPVIGGGSTIGSSFTVVVPIIIALIVN